MKCPVACTLRDLCTSKLATEVIDSRRSVDTLQSHPCAFGNISWKATLSHPPEEPFGSPILEALNHECIVSRYTHVYQMTIQIRQGSRGACAFDSASYRSTIQQLLALYSTTPQHGFTSLTREHVSKRADLRSCWQIRT